MSGETFSPLSNLNRVYLNGNKCIDENFIEPGQIEVFSSIVSEKCDRLQRISNDKPPTVKPNLLTSAFPTRNLQTRRYSAELQSQYSTSTSKKPLTVQSQQCGNVSFTIGLVVGGAEVVRGSWPFIVAMHLLETEKFFCGGTLISTQHVLTGGRHQLT